MASNKMIDLLEEYNYLHETGTLTEVLEAAGYLIYDSIYLSLMGRFECEDEEAMEFISECILERLLSTHPTMSKSEFDQTLFNIMSFEYAILTDGEEYILCLKDDTSPEEYDLTEYVLGDDDYKVIIDEIKRSVKIDFTNYGKN